MVSNSLVAGGFHTNGYLQNQSKKAKYLRNGEVEEREEETKEKKTKKETKEKTNIKKAACRSQKREA